MGTSSDIFKLSHFVKEIEFKNIPKPVLEKAKMCLLDTLGVILAGNNSEIGETIISMFKDWNGNPEAIIFGEGSRLPSPSAAFVNGTMGHYLELDDGNRFALGHPGITSIPSTMAIAEKINANGKEVLESIVVGYEIFSRIARAINPSHRSRGFHTTGTCGTIGAAAAAGKLLDLDNDVFFNCLGIAALQPGGLMEVMRGDSNVKSLNAGRAAHNGVLSALLAAHGLKAPASIFEGANGFFRAYSDSYNIKEITAELGEKYHIMDTYVKLHASCRHIHPAIDAILYLLKNNEFNYEKIEKIHIKTYKAAYDLTGTEYEPKNESTAKFSLPFSIATVVQHGKITQNDFTNDNLKDKKTLSLARKVEVTIDPLIDKKVPNLRGASAEIILNDGRKYEFYVDNARGEPENPATKKEIIDKFKVLSQNVLDETKINKIINTVGKIEKLDKIEDLTKLLA